MAAEAEVLRRDCFVEDEAGSAQPLTVRFYAPAYNHRDGAYRTRANIRCVWFERDVHGVGEDPAQAFFALPIVVVSYLIGQRRFGYEAYWFERGDLDYSDF